jgi:hypothetical protein
MLDRALEKGLIESVDADPEGAAALLADARRHLETATAASATDPNGAYGLGYDAARKAIVAHLLARGLRVAKNRPGAHETTGRYGVAEIADDPSFRAFDRMRRSRNRTEYGPGHIGEEVLREDLSHAQAIVDAVAERL